MTNYVTEIELMVLILLGFGQIVELFHTGLRRLNRRNELELARVNGLQCLGQGRQAVDSLFHRRIVSRGRTVSMMDLSILLEE